MLAPVLPDVQPQLGGAALQLPATRSGSITADLMPGRTLPSKSVSRTAPAIFIVVMPSAEMPLASTRAPIRSSWIGAVPSAIWSVTLPGPAVNVPPTIVPASDAFVGDDVETVNEPVPSRWWPQVVTSAGFVHGVGIGFSPSLTERPAADEVVKSFVWKSARRMIEPLATAASTASLETVGLPSAAPSVTSAVPSWLSTMASPSRSRPNCFGCAAVDGTLTSLATDL